MPGGPKDWALPYWNYSNSAADALLPKPFQTAQIDDPDKPGTKKNNNLHVPQRVAAANAGTAFLSGADTNLNCLKVPTDPAQGFGDNLGASFGGGKTEHHSFTGGREGALEITPHDAVHGALGQGGGFMNGFTTAPLDPIFWLHHCNIDRLWEVWIQRQKQLGVLKRNPNPATNTAAADKTLDQTWLDLVFDFHDEDGKAVTIRSKDLMDTRVAPLSYEYEDTSDPFKGAK